VWAGELAGIRATPLRTGAKYLCAQANCPLHSPSLRRATPATLATCPPELDLGPGEPVHSEYEGCSDRPLATLGYSWVLRGHGLAAGLAWHDYCGLAGVVGRGRAVPGLGRTGLPAER
jgi:hypothetical protein